MAIAFVRISSAIRRGANVAASINYMDRAEAAIGEPITNEPRLAPYLRRVGNVER